MKTLNYNPSSLEVEFAYAIKGLKKEIERQLSANKIKFTEIDIQADNPIVTFFLEDEDGDPHELIIQVIQKPDKF